MNVKLTNQQLQKPVLSISMQQSIEVLLLPLMELNQLVEQELQNNPLLEVDEEKTMADKANIEELLLKNVRRISQSKEEDNEKAYNYSPEGEDNDNEIAVSRPVSLDDVLFKQLRIEFKDPFEYKIGVFILGNINEDGFLTTDLAAILKEFPQANINQIEYILNRIHHFDPLGIASRDLKECLLIQLQYQNLNGHHQLVETLIENHLDLLMHKRFAEISKRMRIAEDEVRVLVQIISKLEPRPARKYQSYEANTYIKPDVIATKDEDGHWQISINQEGLPYLRVNSFYQKMLKASKCKPEELSFIKEKIKAALLFIKSIEQRHETVKNIAKYILEHQRDFFDSQEGVLKPMILSDVAHAISRNESTICRAIHNKYIQTPQGLFSFKYFFSQSIAAGENGAKLSNQSLKEDLQEIVNQEDKKNPLSDEEIEKVFKSRGITIARRTISKYRKLLNILPSSLRKE